MFSYIIFYKLVNVLNVKSETELLMFAVRKCIGVTHIWNMYLTGSNIS